MIFFNCSQDFVLFCLRAFFWLKTGTHAGFVFFGLFKRKFDALYCVLSHKKRKKVYLYLFFREKNFWIRQCENNLGVRFVFGLPIRTH